MRHIKPEALLWMDSVLDRGARRRQSPARFGTCTPGSQTLGSIAPGHALGKGSNRSFWPKADRRCILLLSEVCAQEDG